MTSVVPSEVYYSPALAAAHHASPSFPVKERPFMAAKITLTPCHPERRPRERSDQGQVEGPREYIVRPCRFREFSRQYPSGQREKMFAWLCSRQGNFNLPFAYNVVRCPIQGREKIIFKPLPS